MKNKIVADGFQRFLRGRRALKSESIRKKYAAELVGAGPVEKGKSHESMAGEFLRRKKMLNHKPSAGTLW